MKRRRIHIKKYARYIIFILTPVIYSAVILLFVFILCAGFTAKNKPLIDSIFSANYIVEEEELGSILEEEKEDTPVVTQQKIDISDIVIPDYETVYAKLRIDNLDLSCDLYFGDSYKALKKGAAQYAGSFLPGFGKPLLITGHNHMHFEPLKDISLKDVVTITTNYGEFKYEVKDLAVKKANDSTAYNLEQDKEQLILYTCYPFNKIGITDERFFIYADKISGPDVIWQSKEVAD